MKREKMLSSPLRDHSALLQLGLNRVQFVEQLLLVALYLTKATCYTLYRQRELLEGVRVYKDAFSLAVHDVE